MSVGNKRQPAANLRPPARLRTGFIWFVLLALVVVAATSLEMPGYAHASKTPGKAKHPKCKKIKNHKKRKCKKRRHPQAFSPGLPKRPTVKVPFGGRGGTADPGNDYPAVWRNAPQDSMLDNWREYNRECTSFVAWALSSRNGFNMPFYDNANNWGPRARAQGFTVNSTPSPGSVAWSNAGTYGHVAYVQDVAGGSIHIEEYNHAGTGQYSSRVVSPSAFTGYIHFKDRATQAAPAPPSTPQSGPIDTLAFVKKKNTGGTVEAHWDTVQGGSYKRVGAATSDFSPLDAANGRLQLFGSANGAPQLGFIKTKNTGGTIEVHWDNLQGGSYKRAGSFKTDFSPADAGNGTWQLFGSANGAPQLGFIKTKNTGGTIEVHWDNLQGGTFRRVGDYVSDFAVADGKNGTWSLYGSGNPILGFVKYANTGSGKIEGHSSSLQGNSYKRIADYVSDFSAGDAGNGIWRIGFP